MSEGSGDPLGIAKAVTESGIPAAVETITELVRSLLGPAAEEAGLFLQDRVRTYRLGNQIKALSRVHAQIQNAGLRTHEVPLRTLVPLLEGCSWEEDETLREMWASLIANAGTGSAEVPPVFAHIMSQLSPDDAALLRSLFVTHGWVVRAGTECARPSVHLEPGEPWGTPRAAAAAWKIEVSVSNLEKQGLIALQLSFRRVEELVGHVRDAGVSHSFFGRATGLERGLQNLVLTGLGEAFLLAALPPLSRPVVVDIGGVRADDVNRLRLLARALEGAMLAAQRRGADDLEGEIRSELSRLRETIQELRDVGQ